MRLEPRAGVLGQNPPRKGPVDEDWTKMRFPSPRPRTRSHGLSLTRRPASKTMLGMDRSIPPLVDESAARLKRAGWSTGETGTVKGWLVDGTNGENRIEARGHSQAEAWWLAAEQARGLGMLGRG